MRLRMLVVLLGLGAGLLLAEVALRVLGISSPRMMNVDPVLGPVRIPGRRWTQSVEGSAAVVINALGFRDRDWEMTKPADSVRIALLGDSYVEGLQVAGSATMCSTTRATSAGILCVPISAFATAVSNVALPRRASRTASSGSSPGRRSRSSTTRVSFSSWPGPTEGIIRGISGIT